MIDQIFSHAYAAITLLSLIIIIDLAINFKKPVNLKVFFLILAGGIFMLNLARLFELHYFFAEIGRTLVLISGYFCFKRV